eukprot:4030241-Amphidinium_carterae.1
MLSGMGIAAHCVVCCLGGLPEGKTWRDDMWLLIADLPGLQNMTFAQTASAARTSSEDAGMKHVGIGAHKHSKPVQSSAHVRTHLAVLIEPSLTEVGELPAYGLLGVGAG